MSLCVSSSSSSLKRFCQIVLLLCECSAYAWMTCCCSVVYGRINYSVSCSRIKLTSLYSLTKLQFFTRANFLRVILHHSTFCFNRDTRMMKKLLILIYTMHQFSAFILIHKPVHLLCPLGTISID